MATTSHYCAVLTHTAESAAKTRQISTSLRRSSLLEISKMTKEKPKPGRLLVLIQVPHDPYVVLGPNRSYGTS